MSRESGSCRVLVAFCICHVHLLHLLCPSSFPSSHHQHFQFNSNMRPQCLPPFHLSMSNQGRCISRHHLANLLLNFPTLSPAIQSCIPPSHCHQISSSSKLRSLGCLTISSLACTNGDKSPTIEPPTPSHCLRVLASSCFDGSRYLTRATRGG